SLRERVDVRVGAVAVVCEFLHLRILQVAGAEPEYAQEHARLTLLLDESDEFIVAAHTDIEVAISREDHSIIRVLGEARAGLLIREPDAPRAVRRSTGTQPPDRFEDLLLMIAVRGRQNDARTARIDDERDRVLLAQLTRQHLQRGLH